MDFDYLFKKNYHLLSDLDILLGEYILEHKAEMPTISITQLAKKSYVSKSSILRFVQKLGFSGFSEFKLLVEWHTKVTEQAPQDFNLTSITTHLEQMLKQQAEQDLQPLFEKFSLSRNIYLFTTGMAQKIQGESLQTELLKLGISVTLIPLNAGTDIMNSVIEKISQKDLIIAISFSGENKVLKEALAIPLSKNIAVFSISSSENNWLANHSDFTLPVETSLINSEIVAFTTGYFHFTLTFFCLRFKAYLKEKRFAETNH